MLSSPAVAAVGPVPVPAVATPTADPPAAGSGRHLSTPALALRPTQSTPSVATLQPVTFLHPPSSSGGVDASSSMPRIVSIDGYAPAPGESKHASALLVHSPGADGAADDPVRVRSLSFGSTRAHLSASRGFLPREPPQERRSRTCRRRAGRCLRSRRTTARRRRAARRLRSCVACCRRIGGRTRCLVWRI
ncbi:hypothetical protein AMAG_18027 [Allomyces macrogynus ATCC 38327]|uniref:Uncharacterized protein n=1 Tax=Allomyces macrogynus (strain ATCC 38327) TaxID=578462 RepID=A0A0L0S4H0_ALLM3|nr:hypothetical protein AMAG_18027 [Allomyces macrogynus ATCC 38327]|eukprot:KNE57269.1 hypothetical protein AMAG_18027 [Allomyces macrogynus ATCC 38327]